MVKYLLGILTGIVLIFLLAVFVVILLVTLRSAEPAITKDSVLVLRLSGSVPEHIPMDFSLEFLQAGRPTTMLELRQIFLKAAKDDRIRAIALECGDLGVGWARAQEIRWNIEEFKKSGKPVLAIMQVGDTIDYYVASAADEVYLMPESLLDVKGLRAEVAFFKDTLEKLGVVAEMEHVGKYKSAVEP